jgi:opacity protein-like surface antigen
MKKVLTAAVLAATLSSTAFAAHLTTANPNRDGVFKNRGQCQSMLMRERNEYRKTGNQAALLQFSNAECRRVSEVNLMDPEFAAAVVNPDINAERDANSFVVDFLLPQ